MNQYIIKLFALLAMQFSLNSCAQNSKKQDSMNIEYRDKIKNNYKNVKSYNYNPIYQVRYENFNCPMELYINDILVVYLGGNGKSAGEQIVQIPDYILKSGIQTIRVKIFPLEDKNKNFEKFVSRDVQLKLRVTYQDYEREKSGSYNEVFKAELPKLEKDVPSIIFNKEFTATVPYELEGWSNGMDLSKEDPDKLEKELNDRLEEIADLYRKKNIEGLAKEQYNRTREFAQAYYFNTKENSAKWESELQEALNESKRIDLLSGKMKLMANGKLVTILVKDGVFRNEATIRSDVGDSYDFFSHYFYRPSASAKLEVIR